MNEITRIHLAKVAYDIEIDAKKKLERYIREIEHVTPDSDMLYEIELRMVELLAERGVAAAGVVTLDDVKALQQALGSAKDFSDEDVESVEQDEKPERKFFRDEQNGVIGGVCSGIAAYFAIDVWLVRIVALVLLVLTSGGIALAYIALMLFIPAAKTASDRLQMAGRSTTIQALKDIPPMPVNVSRMVRFTRIAAQILASLVLVGGIIGVIAVLVMGLTLSVSLFDFSALPLVGMFIGLGSLGLAAVVLALFALIMMIVKLTAPKRLVVTFWAASIAAVVLGAIAMIGLAASARYITSDQTQDVTTKKEVSLVGTKKLSVNSNDMTNVTYVVTTDKSYIETHRPKYLKEQPIDTTVSGTDDKQLTIIPTMSTLCRFTNVACDMTNGVIVYGPALEEVTIGSGVYFTYKNTAPQQQLRLTYQDGVSGGGARVEVPSIDTLAIAVHSGGMSSADIVATKIGTITAAVSADAQMTLTASADVGAIHVHTSEQCEPGADGNVRIVYKNVQTVTVQGQSMTLPRDDQLQTTQSCVTVQPLERNFEIR